MTLRFDFFYENADIKYFLALLQKLANACSVDLRAESSAEILSVFASAESSEILSKFASFLQVEVPHSLYFKLKNAELCKEVRGEKIALDLKNIFSLSEINAIKDPKNPRFCEISADSAISQNLNKNKSARSAHLESRPLRGAKNRIQASSSASADFLLEAEKRGSPPKSEKRQLLARRGSGAGGAALLRKEKNENGGDGGAESTQELQSGLQETSHSLVLPREQSSLAIKNKDFADSALDSASLKSTLQNICTALQNGQSVALSTSRGEILLSAKSDDFDFILANDIATLNLYARATQDEISALASFEKPLIELAIKEVFVREVGAKCAKFILPFDIALCCLSSMLLAQNIAFVRGKFAESSAESSKFFEIVVGQNGYFLHKNYVDSADFREFLALNFGAESSANNIASEQGECGNPQNIIIYLSLQNPSIFACGGEKIINIAFDKNPKNILQKITNLENGEKLIANFGKEFKARYEAILALDSAPQMSENLLDIFECAAMILGFERDKSAILNLAQGYLRDIGPKIDFKNYAGGNSSLDLHSADFANLGRFADFSPVSHPKFAKNHESQTENPSVVDSARNAQNLGENQIKNAESSTQIAESRDLQSGLPRAINCARNDDSFLDSSPTAQNDNFMKNAESTLDSAPSTQEANSSIFDEKSGLCSCERENRTNGSLTKRATNLPDLSHPTGCEALAEAKKDDEFAPFYDELRTVRSIISFTLAGTEPEVVAFGILESLADYLVLLFRDAQNQFVAKNITITGDMFANKVFFDKITKKIPADFKLIFPKYLDISSARRASCKT